ncbi:MAG: hypothetical protein E7592_01440 [Ruminococcaceae bacterium]|nr:hypothetical protein [Oscillospiraceae bacterium]
MYNGVSISELRLILHSVVFTLLFIVLIVTAGFWIYVSLTMKNPKEKEHLRKLKEKAQSDELAKKQLEKIERKNKRRHRREKENIITDVIIWSISVCLAIVILAWGIIPGWIDYIRKDYVVYKGEITVYQQMRRSRIELEDGTVIWGIGNFDQEDTYGTVIYSRRTKQFLGGSH